MARNLWLPKRTLAELREIKRCAVLASRRKPFTFEDYQHKRGADPIAHVAEDSLLSLKGAISGLLVSHGSLIRSFLHWHCGSVALEIVTRLPGWAAYNIAAEHDRMIAECAVLEAA
jgi:hypothetical protein